MIRISHILICCLLIFSCDKSIIDPVHSNPFDMENEETFGNPLQLRATNYPDKIKIEWNDITADESNLEINGFRLIRKSFSTNDTILISSPSKVYHDDFSEYLQWDSTYTYKLVAVHETQNEFSISEEETIQVTRKIIVGKDSLDLNIDYSSISIALGDIKKYYDNNPDSLNLVFDIHVQDAIYFENIKINTPVKLICEEGNQCTIDGNNDQVILIEEDLVNYNYSSLDTSNLIISGFTIQNGSAPNEGAGLKINGASPKFVNCDFKDNISGEYGGGVYIENASPVFSNCNFLNNTTYGKGGAGYIINSGVEFIDCVFTGNKADSDNDKTEGGALYINNQAEKNIFISRCIFDNNKADLGAAIYINNNQSSVIQYSLFTSNTSNCYLGVCGTVFFSGESESILNNVTFADNHLWGLHHELSAASIYADNSTISVVNAILWNNITDGSNDINEIMGNIEIRYSNIYDDTLWTGEGNKNNDPLFIDPENGDYTLQEDSPCIDAGTPDINMNGSDDIETYNGTAPDMGRYESDY